MYQVVNIIQKISCLSCSSCQKSFWLRLSRAVPLWLVLFFYVIPAFAQNEIENVLKTNHCPECHRFGPQKKLTNKQKIAPDLFYAGEKFQEEWLIGFLIKPEIIRPSGYITDPDYLEGKPRLKSHVRLSKQNALLVSKYLLTLKSGFLEKVRINSQSKKSRLNKGKKLFDRQYGCVSCHRAQNLMGVVKGGISGPSFSNAGNRLRGEWIFNRLKNPTLFEEKSRMPFYKIPDEENVMITEYILSQLKENERK